MKKQQGFTLIELLVVIAIIGLLSTLAVVALNNARMKSRDAKRISDVKQVQTALELYYNDAGIYPTNGEIAAGDPIITGGVTYMAAVPSNPTPKTDGATACPDSDYTYVQADSGASYTLTYCLGGPTGGITCAADAQCLHTAYPGGIQ